MMSRIKPIKYQALILLSIIAVTPIQMAWAQESPIIQKARNFLSQALNISATTIIERPEVIYDIIGLPYKILNVDSTYDIWVAEDGTAVYGYTKKDMFSGENLNGKTNADAISEEYAFNAIGPVLNYLDLSTSKSDYYMSFRDMGTEGDEDDDLWGCMWIIRKEMELNGIPCRGRGFSGSVSGASQTVNIFRYLPTIMPENQSNVVVSYTEARQNALNWLQEHPYFETASPFLVGDENTGVQVIAPQHQMFELNEAEQTEATKTYYCWEIYFSWTEYNNDFNGVIWVNIDTGEIVGASG